MTYEPRAEISGSFESDSPRCSNKFINYRRHRFLTVCEDDRQWLRRWSERTERSRGENCSCKGGWMRRRD